MGAHNDSSGNPKARLLIVEDHFFMREGIKAILERDEALEVAGEARDAQEAISRCRDLHPDLILMDVSMPEMDGIEATRRIKGLYPHTTVLILTSRSDPQLLMDAVKAGAAGYVLKEDSQHRMLDAIRAVLGGETYLDQKLVMTLLRSLGEDADARGVRPPAVPATPVAAAPLQKPLTPRETEILGHLARGEYIEHDGKMHAFAQTLPWGIDKIDADSSSTKAGDGTGAITSVNAYVIDTGIDAGHTDLNVTRNVNFTGGPNTDCNGHGTHVAGTVAAEDNAQDVVGGVPGALLAGVKVLGCSGSGSYSGVIAGIEWVTTNAARPAVANMSLGGPVSQSVDDAVKKSVASSITYAVAAGNDGADACNSSPARAGAGTNNGILTVAATDSSDRAASFSNYGPCVDIWAPSVSILSTKRGGGTTTMSGTSMASPHGAAGAALYLSSHTSASPSAVESALKSAATTTANKSKDGRTIIRENVAGF